MTNQHGLLILHLSDLHFGNHNRFADRDVAKLGKAFFRAVEHARTQAEIPAHVQLVIISGDVAETGKPKEFEQAGVFLDALSGEIGLDHTRFVFTPGNHDLSWPLCKKVAADQEIEGFDDAELRRRMDAVKFEFYHALLARVFGTPLAEVPGRRPLASGGWLHEFPELRLAVAALNTCELESHRAEDHRGHLSLQQAESLMDTWRRDPYLGWLKIVVVHHNPIATTLSNIQDWTKYMKSQPEMAVERIDHYAADVVGFDGRELLERIVRDCRAHLVLHGHHHDLGEPIEWPWLKDGRAPVLSTGSWGLINGKLPGDAPPACQLLLVTPDAAQPRLEAYPLVYNGRFRLEGDLLPGNFVADPADRGRYSQPLHLPAGWPNAASLPATKTAMSKAATAFMRRYRQRMGSLFDQWDLRHVGVTQGGGANRPIDTRLDDIYQPLRLTYGFGIEETGGGMILDVDAIQQHMELHPSTTILSGDEELGLGGEAIDVIRQAVLRGIQPLADGKEAGATLSIDRRSKRSRLMLRLSRRTSGSGPAPLAIRGPAGSGKTTWMRYTFRRLLENDDMLPLLIVLRDVARRWNDRNCLGAARSIDAVLDACIAEHLGRGWEGRVTELLDAGRINKGPRVVLVVDGWDELGPLGVEFREKLFGFHRDHPHVLIIVSSRPYGEGRPTDSDGFLTLDIQPLSTTEIDAFAERFFRLCYREDATTCRNEVTRFRGALDRSPEAATLAQTALLLTMMLLISRSEQLPDKRHLLYERCLHNFLTALPDRREEAGVLLSDHQFRPNDSELRQQVTAALAFGTQSAGYEDGRRSTIVLKWDEMAAFLPSGWSRQQRDGFLTWLAGPAGVLTDRADGTLVFAHLSFQEFLTAWHLNATVVSPEEVAEQFAVLAQNSTWWETLLLWGAMISGQNAERLNPVIRRLLEESYGPSLVGMMAADGTGTDAASEDSTVRFAERLLRTLPEGWERCLHAWNSSRQEERRRRLCEALTIVSQRAGWLAWLRLEETRVRLGSAVDLTLPDNVAAARVIMALRGSRDEPDIAAGRILCGGPPLWPGNPSELSWLQMWPSHRRLASLRLQQGVSSGASREEVCAAARWELSPSVPTAQHRQTARELAVYWADDWARDWADHRVGELAVYQWAGDVARDWARDLARDLAVYWARNWDVDWCGNWHPDFPLAWPRELPRNWARELARDLARKCHQDSTPDWTAESASDWAREWARWLSCDSAGEWAQEWACKRCHEWALTAIPPWIFDFARVEIVSFGRGAVRWAAASLRTNHLLSVACRLSLWPIAERHTNNVAALGQYDHLIDPLWPALGRHLARRSTDEDRALLVDLALHPEKREPPLRWGLQYIVRGDLLLADGSVLTLDELADEVGLPHLPYLDEMEPEIELD